MGMHFTALHGWSFSSNDASAHGGRCHGEDVQDHGLRMLRAYLSISYFLCTKKNRKGFTHDG